MLNSWVFVLTFSVPPGTLSGTPCSLLVGSGWLELGPYATGLLAPFGIVVLLDAWFVPAVFGQLHPGLPAGATLSPYVKHIGPLKDGSELALGLLSLGLPVE